jgi:hypothetical protein
MDLDPVKSFLSTLDRVVLRFENLPALRSSSAEQVLIPVRAPSLVLMLVLVLIRVRALSLARATCVALSASGF